MENNIENLFKKSSDIKEFSAGYFKYLSSLLNSLDLNSIASFVEQLEEARKNRNTVFVIGNGGSASTASHMAGDFSFGSRRDYDGLPLKVIALTDNIAAVTASANDCGYDTIFLRQLKVYYNPGDKLIAISASGNSPNIITAAEWVGKQGGKTIGMVGFDGGKLKSIADILIHVKAEKGEYGPVEDIHMILEHLIYTWIWYLRRN
jgi:D-sedoheptulose 7-phosphate isomerase